MNELFLWIFTFIITMSAPSDPGHLERGGETEEQTITRYEEIANDLIDIVYDPNNKPLFDEPDGRSHTAAVMLGIMYHESKFYRHVDIGKGPGSKGDNGRSWCLMQVMAGKRGKTGRWNFVHDRQPYWGDPESEITDGVTGIELVEDRKVCLREGLRIARWSFSRCRNRGISEKLRIYASGSCSKGGAASRTRMWTAESFWRKTKEKRTWNDSDIVDMIINKNESENAKILESLINMSSFELSLEIKPLFPMNRWSRIPSDVFDFGIAKK